MILFNSKIGMVRRGVKFALVLMLAGCGAVQTDRWFDAEKNRDPAERFFGKTNQQQAGDTSGGYPVSSTVSSETITVQQGDTYYRLAQKYELSVRDLIEVNKARAPYALSAGQSLILPTRQTYSVAQGDTLYSISRKTGIDVHSLARQNKLNAPYHLRIGQELALSTSGKTAQLTAPPKPRGVLDKAPARKGRFIVPVKGRIISTFGSKENGIHNDGINIAVPEGTDVKVAENGVVVYAGNELAGYGNLMLVRHADGFVTAYAHTSQFSVSTGQKVKRGDVIAKSGRSGNVDTPQIHFEIRQGARALNPQKLI